MSEQPAPICQWCQQPAQPPVAWWDDKAQCGDPFACDARIQRKEANR